MTVNKSSRGVSSGFAVNGLAELEKNLSNLVPRLQKNILRGALRAGAAVIADEARRRVSVDTGQLKASIRVSTAIINGQATKAGSSEAVDALAADFSLVLSREFVSAMEAVWRRAYLAGLRAVQIAGSGELQ